MARGSEAQIELAVSLIVPVGSEKNLVRPLPACMVPTTEPSAWMRPAPLVPSKQVYENSLLAMKRLASSGRISPAMTGDTSAPAARTPLTKPAARTALRHCMPDSVLPIIPQHSTDFVHRMLTIIR